MSEKIYESVDGFKCTLSQMVKIEPGWAANRIRLCEKLEAEYGELLELKQIHDKLLRQCLIQYESGWGYTEEFARVTLEAKALKEKQK